MAIVTTNLAPAPEVTPWKRSLIWASVLHGLALLAVLVSAWWPFEETAPPPDLVFELALDLPIAEAVQQPGAANSVPNPQPNPVLPTPAPPPTPPASPAPSQSQPPPPKPSPPPEPRPAPEATPRPQAAPAPKRVTYDQFREEVPLPETPAPARPAPAPAPPRLNVDTNRLSADLERRLQGSSAASAAASTTSEQAALARYLDRLEANMRARWQQPAIAAGPSAEISVTIAPDGTIGQVQLLRVNAPHAFVESVIAAARATPSIGPTPTGKTITARFTFILR